MKVQILHTMRERGQSLNLIRTKAIDLKEYTGLDLNDKEISLDEYIKKYQLQWLFPLTEIQNYLKV